MLGVMPLDNVLNLGKKTRFRLLMECYACGFGFLAAQVALYFWLGPAPLGILVGLPLLLYLVALSKELKKRHEPLTRREKNLRFGVQVVAYAAAVIGLLVAGILKRTPQVWICFGLVAIVSLVILFHAYEQTYKDEGPA